MCQRRHIRTNSWTRRRTVVITAVIAFAFGLFVGFVLPRHMRQTFSVTMPTKLNISSSGWSLNEIVDGIYWGPSVELHIPPGFNVKDDKAWRKMARKAIVGHVQEGCGRMQNRLITFENGTLACCRYRHNADQIQGDVYSFHLARLLGLGNIPPSTVTVARARSSQWKHVQAQLTLAQWREDRPLVLAQFVHDLQPAFIPPCLRTPKRQLRPIAEDLTTLSSKELVELAQWSDLIVFDYLTANLDRVVNNMYNEQWNPAMMESPTHNLAREASTGLLVFLDNESGLLHGYRLLAKYAPYHDALINSLCVFRRPTVAALRSLYKQRNVGRVLNQAFERAEGSSTREWLAPLPPKSIGILNERVARVIARIEHCEQLYGSDNYSRMEKHQG